MLKILIVENDKIKCQKIINQISKQELDVKIYNIAYNTKEALSILKNKIVDLIILDIDELPDTNKIDFFYEIHKIRTEKYKKSIIVISKNNNIQMNNYIYKKLSIPINFNELINDIIKINNYRNKTYLKKQITRELNKLHFKFSYTGTHYLIECIYEVYYINNKFNIKLTKDVFPKIAEKYNSSSNTIHSNIKSAINAMYYDCDNETLRKYFNLYETEKPTLKEIIFKVIDHI